MSKKKKSSSVTPAGESETQSRPQNLSAEGSEPWAQKTPIPAVLLILFTLLFFAGDIYLMANRGDFDPRVYEPHDNFASVESAWPPDPTKALRLQGKRVYANCAACHQANGLGAPGQFPPLAGSEWVLAESPARIVRLVLHGISGPITVSGQSFNAAMPPWGAVLSDDDIAAVVTYIRSEWGNKASPVTAEQVKAIRGKQPERGPWTPDELLKIPLQ